jgi:uncharacterized repeat protein (TIGR03803 family)
VQEPWRLFPSNAGLLEAAGETVNPAYLEPLQSDNFAMLGGKAMNSKWQLSNLSFRMKGWGPTAAILVAVAAAFLVSTISPRSMAAQSFTVIHTFMGPEGAAPASGLTVDSAGDFYGTAAGGGKYGFGTVFKLRDSDSGWTLIPIYSFAGGTDGSTPFDNIAIAADGSLFGATYNGGQGSCQGGCGTVFRLTPGQNVNMWTETVLHRFTGGADGALPYGSVVFGPNGYLYGTTYFGGNVGFTRCADVWITTAGCGVVYELAPSGNSWVETVLYAPHDLSVGVYPTGNVMADRSGNLYGVLSYGDLNGGAVYNLSQSGSRWNVEILYDNFGVVGSPWWGLTMDSSGNLYGMGTTMGFELSPGSGGWELIQIPELPVGGSPGGKLVMDASGNLYGATWWGGAYGQGAIFKLTSSPTGWTYTSLHDFTCGDDGCLPQTDVAFDAAGNLYGTASYGGSPCPGNYGCGVVWKITQ